MIYYNMLTDCLFWAELEMNKFYFCNLLVKIIDQNQTEPMNLCTIKW